MNEIDHDALTRALTACSGQDAARAKQIDSMLQDEPWEKRSFGGSSASLHQ
jgi:hypothetical protein